MICLHVVLSHFLFFFKQKTAYEMRISDWSSDVCSSDLGVNLAVSLHAVTKEVRDEIVPINKKYGIEELLAACAAYPGANNARRITFEYVMLKGKNDSDDDARELVRLIRKYRLPAKVNLIPFNPRSEEHTSELQSLMRISYAVFCLKKKKTTIKE